MGDRRARQRIVRYVSVVAALAASLAVLPYFSAAWVRALKAVVLPLAGQRAIIGPTTAPLLLPVTLIVVIAFGTARRRLVIASVVVLVTFALVAASVIVGARLGLSAAVVESLGSLASGLTCVTGMLAATRMRLRG